MFLLGFASFYGLLAVWIRKVRAAGLAGFSLVLLCSKHDFTCFYKVLLAFMGFLPFGSERRAPAETAALVGFSFWL